jgi:hypothetical protein
MRLPRALRRAGHHAADVAWIAFVNLVQLPLGLVFATKELPCVSELRKQPGRAAALERTQAETFHSDPSPEHDKRCRLPDAPRATTTEPVTFFGYNDQGRLIAGLTPKSFPAGTWVLVTRAEGQTVTIALISDHAVSATVQRSAITFRDPTE